MRRVICPSSAFHKAAMLCVLAVKYFLMLLFSILCVLMKLKALSVIGVSFSDTFVVFFNSERIFALVNFIVRNIGMAS